jgi:hypothetical protein
LIAMQELGFLHKGASKEKKLGYHAVYVAVFLVFAHLAMIAGMTDPSLLGYKGSGGHGAATQEHTMTGGDAASGHQGGMHK